VRGVFPIVSNSDFSALWRLGCVLWGLIGVVGGGFGGCAVQGIGPLVRVFWPSITS
jgi:hypothetical protein